MFALPGRAVYWARNNSITFEAGSTEMAIFHIANCDRLRFLINIFLLGPVRRMRKRSCIVLQRAQRSPVANSSWDKRGCGMLVEIDKPGDVCMYRTQQTHPLSVRIVCAVIILVEPNDGSSSKIRHSSKTLEQLWVYFQAYRDFFWYRQLLDGNLDMFMTHDNINMLVDKKKLV